MYNRGITGICIRIYIYTHIYMYIHIAHTIEGFQGTGAPSRGQVPRVCLLVGDSRMKCFQQLAEQSRSHSSALSGFADFTREEVKHSIESHISKLPES